MKESNALVKEIDCEAHALSSNFRKGVFATNDRFDQIREVEGALEQVRSDLIAKRTELEHTDILYTQLSSLLTSLKRRDVRT